ncbi:protease SohB [Endozoicomonas sp. SCSIO W0465]|uniref:protease SohB n=1 Tax=Endozoicomonas sp. SCSIO W0465 TaxID=2918516 RepID=UPI0020760352|nr:protease SohB [Endozoicomonas sp. SCSIO W0465]USE39478.1 protease SohB [Endozoicomonas sp. SCSIO W0465]
MDYLADFFLFLAKTVTLIGGVAILVALVTAIGQKAKKMHKGHLEITCLNEHYEHLQTELKHALLDKAELKKTVKEEKEKAKLEKKAKKNKPCEEVIKPKVFILDFHGDIKASAVKSLREEITAVLSLADKERDEVIIRLESGGGLVHSYGLAASQLKRIRDKGVKLTVTVDKVAASGGYMMACVANHIVAAPFAILGSIGVMAQLPNVHRLLKKHDVDIELHTAGEFKRTLTVLGQNTEKGRQKFIQDMEDTHLLFKDFVKMEREVVDINQVSTGEIWYGLKALTLNLIDEISTSDEYIYRKVDEADLVQVEYVIKKGVADKFGLAAETALDNTLMKWWGRFSTSRFFS